MADAFLEDVSKPLNWEAMETSRRLSHYFTMISVENSPDMIDVIVTLDDSGRSAFTPRTPGRTNTMQLIESIREVGGKVDNVETKVDRGNEYLINIQRDLAHIKIACDNLKRTVRCQSLLQTYLAVDLPPNKLVEMDLYQVPRFFVVIPEKLDSWNPT